MKTEEEAGRSKPSSTLALIGKVCPNCGLELNFLENPPVIVPDDLGELEWDYVKNLLLGPQGPGDLPQVRLRRSRVPDAVEARGTYVGT